MPAEKATVINTETGEQIRVLFNPEEYSLDLGNDFAEVAIPGLSAPPIQFVRGKGKSLEMELFVDTYEQRVDVRGVIAQLSSLMNKDARTGAPPVLLLTWASLSFECVLASLGQRFTMFLDDGTPVRAKLNASFKEYRAVEIEVATGFFIGPPTVRTLVEGMTLSQVAAEELGDPFAWREIAEANGIEDPLNLIIGTDLIIPSKGP